MNPIDRARAMCRLPSYRALTMPRRRCTVVLATIVRSPAAVVLALAVIVLAALVVWVMAHPP